MADLTGQEFGVFTVLGLDEEKTNNSTPRRIYWQCRCNECGAISSVRTDGLKRLPKHCQQCRYGNLIGQHFGKLIVVSDPHKKDEHGHRYWHCKCECGNEKDVLGTNLLTGKVISCGCEHSRITSELMLIDLTGQKFGLLTVLSRDLSEPGNKRTKWLCKCDCGTICSVEANNLKNGHTSSCGCLRSKGEFLIRQWLNKYNIHFLSEYSFSDLPKRRFDFAIFQDTKLICLIEFDGQQHYIYNESWYQTLEEFQAGQSRDEEKNIYCQTHNIHLYRIRYDENIEEILKDIMLKENILSEI